MIDPSSGPFKFIVVGILVLYFIFGRLYQEHLQNTYGYKLFGLPLIIAVAGAAISSFFAPGGSHGYVGPAESTFAIILRMLAFATPGVVIATIGCFIKTRKLFLCLVNIPLLYLLAVVAGVYVIVAILAVVAIFFLRGFASETSRTANTVYKTKYEDHE